MHNEGIRKEINNLAYAIWIFKESVGMPSEAIDNWLAAEKMVREYHEDGKKTPFAEEE